MESLSSSAESSRVCLWPVALAVASSSTSSRSFSYLERSSGGALANGDVPKTVGGTAASRLSWEVLECSLQWRALGASRSPWSSSSAAVPPDCGRANPCAWTAPLADELLARPDLPDRLKGAAPKGSTRSPLLMTRLSRLFTLEMLLWEPRRILSNSCPNRWSSTIRSSANGFQCCDGLSEEAGDGTRPWDTSKGARN
uniref:Putative secreted protein n=1 Tax=Ixodes ricinus TaxID=34613 RepID=A0A6B0V241_IXORI